MRRVIALFLCLFGKAISNDIITKVEENWNTIESMSGKFEQTDTDGKILRGDFSS